MEQLALATSDFIKWARIKYTPTLIGVPDRFADTRVIKINDIRLPLG